MSRIMHCETRIDVYDQDNDNLKVIVKEYWNMKELVVLKIESKEYVVSADSLQRAIINAQNCHPF